MILSKNSSEKVLKYGVNYENEDVRLLINDAIQNHNVTIKINGDAPITMDVALSIWETASRDYGHRFTITGCNSFRYNLEKKAS